MSRSSWPGFWVFRLILGWIVAVFAVAAWRAYWAVSQAAADGVAAAAFDLKKPALLAFGPPLLLVVAGILLRRRSERPRA